jgi:hypothetical protein
MLLLTGLIITTALKSLLPIHPSEGFPQGQHPPLIPMLTFSACLLIPLFEDLTLGSSVSDRLAAGWVSFVS